MRLCPGWAGNPASVRLVKTARNALIRIEVRVQSLPDHERQTAAGTWIPGEPDENNNSGQKNPSVATFKGKPMSIKLFGTPAPASTMSLQLMLLPPASCSRGQVGKGYFANSPSKLAIRWPTVNDL
jgi:hypothetical protein